jgi:hypothetical protein
MTKFSTLDLALQAARDSTGRAQDVARLRGKLNIRLATEPTPLEASGPAAVSGAGKLLWFIGCALGVTFFGTVAWRAPLPLPRTPVLRAVENGPSAVAHSSPVAAPQAEQRTATALPSDAKKPKARLRTRSHAAHADPAVAPDPAAEIVLITRAQGLIERQPVAALAVLLEHAQRFPHGLLAEERDVLRFDAERTLGHSVQALADAQAFLQQHPGSTQARRIERWLAAQQNAATLHNLEPERLPNP